MKALRIVSIFLARFFLSLIFLISAVHKIFNWNDTENLLMNALCDWQSHAGFSQSVQECVTVLVPWGSLLLVFGTLFELIGSLMVLFGYKEKIGASLLLLFLVPTTLLFHSFWFLEGGARELQEIMFFKNLAIFGGLILIAIHGAQAKSNEGSLGFS